MNSGEEAKEILDILKSKFSDKIDGKSAILEMKDRNMRNWRQMEWQGFYFEDIGRYELINTIGGSEGPNYGRTKFDYKRNFIWDLKLHSIFDKDEVRKPWLILNDAEAIENVINDTGGLGFIISNAVMTFDKTGEFKQWHDIQKGGKSAYEMQRINRGAPSRMRKTSFKINSWLCLYFNDFSIFDEGMSNDWVNEFQRGMRNANGSPRRPKVMIDVEKIPQEYVVMR